MNKFASNQLGVAQGARVLFSDYADGGPMWTGTGPREERFTVVFEERFAAPPAVQVALSMWDIDHKHNQRMDISAEEVSETGFELVFRTWGDSRVARVRANWTAIGPMPHEDDWELY